MNDALGEKEEQDAWDLLRRAYAMIAEASKTLETAPEVARFWHIAADTFSLYAKEARERAELHDLSSSATKP